MAAEMLPSFTTLPLAPLRVYFMMPAMKSVSLMPWVVAVNECTSTDAVGEKYMPAGLDMTTWPLALICPKICEAELPKMRLSKTLLLDGCVMLTLASLPTLKLCQLMAARWLSWVMAMVAPDWAMRALPALT